MKTYMAKAESVERKWYVVDAAGVPLGRLASRVASVLRGKNKPTYTPNVDTGDGGKERPCRLRSSKRYVAQEQPWQTDAQKAQSL